ncbi:hypothetical protein WHL20_14480, partial [Staphylococcus aureus]|uniref:hypothetical protein n=1 Tax=Staphylococcus aureus TaxID=1280 RepID=UPI0039BE9517
MFIRLFRTLLALSLVLGSPLLYAQSPDAQASTATPAQTLQQLSGQLNAVKSTLSSAQKDKLDNTALADLRTRTMDVQGQAQQLADGLAPQMSA